MCSSLQPPADQDLGVDLLRTACLMQIFIFVIEEVAGEQLKWPGMVLATYSYDCVTCRARHKAQACLKGRDSYLSH